MKETKEMMKILKENKRKEQLRKMESKKINLHAKDIFITVWMSAATIICFYLITLL